MILDPASAAGAVLLAVATVPQFVRLARTRDAASLSAWFIGLNAAGLLLLTWRSAQLGDAAFLGINLLGAAFWAWTGWLKFRTRGTPGGSPTHQSARALRQRPSIRAQ